MLLTKKPDKRARTRMELAKKWTGLEGIRRLFPATSPLLDTGVGQAILDACDGKVCEVGCGDGRLAPLFCPDKYMGVDINKKAVDLARYTRHGYMFKHIGWDDNYPEADTYLFHTVLLHLPPTELEEVVYRLSCHEKCRVVIGETMSGWLRDYGEEFHRDPQAYVAVFGYRGFSVHSIQVLPIKQYPWHTHVVVLDARGRGES